MLRQLTNNPVLLRRFAIISRSFSKLTSVHFPNGLTEIGAGAFFRCTKLTSVSFPNSLTKIEAGAFATCTGLISVHLPNSLSKIGARAFYGSGLISIQLPSLTEIGEKAFAACVEIVRVDEVNSQMHTGSQVMGGLMTISHNSRAQVLWSAVRIGAFPWTHAKVLPETITQPL